MSNIWNVYFTKKTSKKLKTLPNKVMNLLNVLTWEIERYGPVRGNWPNYSKLGPNRHHCHLTKKGKPTFVAVWEESETGIQLVEITYVGSREKAPY